ncbi:hypothetical protein FSARC_3419 [Fusarium sarcochroum]|uniref:Uncharacterized protein n=1 Tax=Fusarium sarcochroum TaxID=1208366 RepID=A0A8H4U4C6_9HYPO|nr:hypothetical protein FSARC_3419 [Fusarium sarcochroum]
MGAISTPSSKWTESSGVHTRRADSLESFFAVMGDIGAPFNKQHWAINSALKLSFSKAISDLIPFLQKAWLTTRRLHPIIDATISAPDPQNPLKDFREITVPVLEPESYLERTFFLHDTNVKDDTTLTRQLTNDHFGTIHWIPVTRELLIYVSHSQFDGIGLLMLWSGYLGILAGLLRDGIDYKPDVGSRLTSSIDELISSPMDEGTTPEALKLAADNMIDVFLQGVPGVGLHLKSAEGAVPAHTCRRVITLNEISTNAVIKACEKNNYSVSAIAKTALIRTPASYEQHPMAKHFSTLVPVSLRRFLPSPHDKVSYAGGVRVSGWPLLIRDVADKEFSDIAPMVNEVFRKDFSKITQDDAGNDIGLIDCTAPYSRRAIQMFTATPPPMLPPRTTPTMSSLGQVEKYIKPSYEGLMGEILSVDDFFLSLEILNQDQYVHVWTFRNKLHFQVSANSAHYDESFLDDEMERVNDELLLGLGVK